jgi:hypothetical protein
MLNQANYNQWKMRYQDWKLVAASTIYFFSLGHDAKIVKKLQAQFDLPET